MGAYDKINRELCPNGCGELTVFKKPITILYLIPDELLITLYEGVELSEDSFGHIIAHCDKCGFNLSTTPKEEVTNQIDNIMVTGLKQSRIMEVK